MIHLNLSRIRCIYVWREFTESMSLKIVVVMELCPAAFMTRRMKTLQALRYVLENRDNVTVTKVHEGYLCSYKNDARPPVVFEKQPTVEYHRELFDAPRDWSNHVAVVEDALRRMLHTCRGTNPYRHVGVSYVFKCKCCGHDDYIDCGTHYTCTKCAVVSTKVHQGLAYREMRERENLNTSGQTHDSLFSDKYNRQTFIEDWKLQNSHASTDLQDSHKHAAKVVFEDLCSSLRLSPGVARKALVLFCTILPHLPRVRNIGVTYAACMFHALSQ